MKKQFKQQIIAILKWRGSRHPRPRALPQDATFYTWRKKYPGLDVSEARRLKTLEDENARLKK